MLTLKGICHWDLFLVCCRTQKIAGASVNVVRSAATEAQNLPTKAESQFLKQLRGNHLLIATLPVRTMRSAQEMLLNFCLTGHSSRRAFPKLALSSQLNSGSNLYQSLDFFRSILVLIFNLILAPSAPPLPSVTLIVIQAHIFYPEYHVSVLLLLGSILKKTMNFFYL